MKLKEQKVVFDSDNYFDSEDWNDFWQGQIEEGYYEEEELTDDLRYRILAEQEELDWDCLMHELQVLGNQLPYKHYVVAGSVGRWNGTFSGWKLEDSLKDCIYMKDCEYYKIWVDKDGLHIRGVHHDGSNIVTVWGVKPNIDYYDIEDWLYENKHGKLWYKCDNLAPYLCAWYGWEGKYGIKGIRKDKIEQAKGVMKNASIG